MSKLDPHFGSDTGSHLLCELHVSRIKASADAIAMSADRLWLRRERSASLARLDLRKSAQALRDAACRLDALLERREHHQEAAE